VLERSVRAVLIVLVAAFGLAACGTESGGESGQGEPRREEGRAEAVAGSEGAQRPPTPVETVRLASRKTAEAQSARVSMFTVASGTPSGAPEELAMKMEGSVDFADDVSEFTMTMPLFGEMEVRQVGPYIFQRFPQEFAAASLPEGKTWVRVDYDEMMREQYGTTDPSAAGGTAPADLTGQLEYLRGVSESVEELGPEEVRGVPTERYRAVLDLEKSFEGESPELRKSYRELRRQLGSDTLPVEVWIDSAGRVRRYEMAFPVKNPEAPGGDLTMKMTAEYYDFGVPVNVEEPPAAEVVDFEEIQAQQYAARS